MKLICFVFRFMWFVGQVPILVTLLTTIWTRANLEPHVCSRRYIRIYIHIPYLCMQWIRHSVSPLNENSTRNNEKCYCSQFPPGCIITINRRKLIRMQPLRNVLGLLLFRRETQNHLCYLIFSKNYKSKLYSTHSLAIIDNTW